MQGVNSWRSNNVQTLLIIIVIALQILSSFKTKQQSLLNWFIKYQKCYDYVITQCQMGFLLKMWNFFLSLLHDNRNLFSAFQSQMLEFVHETRYGNWLLLMRMILLNNTFWNKIMKCVAECNRAVTFVLKNMLQKRCLCTIQCYWSRANFVCEKYVCATLFSLIILHVSTCGTLFYFFAT